MFQKKGVFLIIVYGLWSEKFALSEKNNCLGFNNSVLCIQRNVPGENFCIKKLFFSKNSRILREKFSNFCEVVSGKVDIIPSYFCRGRFQGKIFSKKVFFFHCFQTWSKKSTIEGTAGYLWKLYSTCLVEFSEEKHSFQSYMIYFFMYFERRIVKFEKKFRRIVKIAFYTSRGTSWCNCFGSLKTYFP